MQRSFVIGAVLLAASVLTFGQAAGSKPISTDGADPQETVREFLDAANAALQREDVPAIERAYAPDWTFVNASGRVLTRAQRLSGLQSGDLKYESIGVGDLNIRIYGNAAVATMRMTLKGQNSGEDFSGQYRVTTVLVSQNGDWQIVAQHSTSIPL